MEAKKLKPQNIIIIAICAAIGAAVPAILNNTVFSPSVKLDKELMQAASEINASCPVMVDQSTRLDNAIAGPDKRFIYNYTILVKIPEDYNNDAFVKDLRPILVNNYKNNPDCQPMFKNGVTVVCRYKRTDGTLIADIPITPKDCGY